MVLHPKVSPFPQVTKRAIRAINPNNDRPLHVSFDIDALDPAESPATGTPGIKLCFAITAQQPAYNWSIRPTLYRTHCTLHYGFTATRSK